MITQRLLLVLLLATLIVAPAWGSSGSVPGVTDTEVALGVTTALSGPAAAWGNSGLGMLAWAQHVNDQGGVHGRKLRVVLQDDGHNPGRAIANLREMQTSVFAVVGLLGSAILRATRDYFGDHQIPLVSPYGAPSIWSELSPQKMRYVFVGSRPDFIDEGTFLATYASELGARKIAVFYQNDDMGWEGLSGVRAGIKRMGGRIEMAGEVSYQLTDRTMGIHALKLRDSGADAVVLYATVTHGANLLKEMAKLGYRPKILSSYLLGDHTTMFRLIGELWEGAHYTVIWTPRGEPQAERVIDTLVKYEPRLAGNEVFGLAGAIPMMLTVEGLTRAGRALTRDSFLAAMETIRDFSPENLTPPITFGQGRRHGANAFRVMKAISAKGNRVVPMTGYQSFPPRY